MPPILKNNNYIFPRDRVPLAPWFRSGCIFPEGPRLARVLVIPGPSAGTATERVNQSPELGSAPG